MMLPEGETCLMVNKCLELCQALGNQGHRFSFSLSIGSNFSFSLDTKEKNSSLDTNKDKITSLDTKEKNTFLHTKEGNAFLDTKDKNISLDTRKVTSPKKSEKKKLSPSQVKRNASRKTEFLKRKSDISETVQAEQKNTVFKCNHCDNLFDSENSLDIHMENVHEANVSFENIEQLDGHAHDLPSLENSTKKDVLEKSELEVVMEILDEFILERNPEELRNQPAKSVADLKAAVSNILMRHLKI